MARLFTRIRYALKRPGTGGRSTFAIIRDELAPDGSRRFTTLTDERIEAINQLVSGGLRGAGEAEAELRALIGTLKAEDARRMRGQTFNEENLQLVERYWSAEYEHRHLVRPDSARNDLLRAIALLGQTSLMVAERPEIEKLVGRLRGNKQRRAASTLNQLLKFVGRGIRLRLARPERRLVRHLTITEFEQLLKRLEPTERPLAATLFATGARLGEAIALTNTSASAAFIDSQIDDDGVRRDTKNRRARHAPIIPGFTVLINQWLSLSPEKRAETSRPWFTKRLQTECARLFPGQSVKRCGAHDLRHSYAIHLLSRGVSLSLVAQALGNSVGVCQEYYAGFVLSPENVQLISDALRAPVAKRQTRRT